MRTMSAEDAQNGLAEMLLKAPREPVTIERSGRPVAVVRSFADHADLDRRKRDGLRAAVAAADRAVARGEVEGVDDIDASADRLMAELNDAVACNAWERASTS